MKKPFIFIVCIIVFIAIALQIHPTAKADIDEPMSGFQLMYGDVNLDGKVSTADACMMLALCNGGRRFNAMQYINGDVNGDNLVNTADVGVTLKYIAGIIRSLPYLPNVNSVVTNSMSFRNNTFPENGRRLTYGRSYALNGLISSNYPLKVVRIMVTDKSSGNIEIDNAVYLNSQDNIKYYNTQTSLNAIDKYIRFSTLSTGYKELKLICSNQMEENTVIFTSEFRIGVTYDEVAGHVYNISDEVSSSEAKKLVALLNTFDYTNSNAAHLVDVGLGYLGESYSTMDCSKFVQTATKNALNFDLPRISVDQAQFCYENGYDVPIDSRRTGDLIFLSRTYCDCGRYHEVHHVAIYLGKYDGTDYILESTGSLGGVVMRRIWGVTSGRWIIDSIARIA